MDLPPPVELEALTFGQDLFSFLLENTPDQVYFKDLQGHFLRASRAVAQYMDIENPEDLIGKSDFDFWSEQTAKEAFDDEQRIIKTGQPMIGKVEKLVHADGRVTWDYTSKLPLKDSKGQIIGICGINKDFTTIKKMEDALAEERNRLRITTDELEAKNAQLESDLRMAREIQLALLPRDYPTLSHFGSSGYSALSFAHCYRPAEAVGGDFFDIFPLSPTRAGIFICDVMGHGLRAALVTAIIRTLLEELRPLMQNPGRFLSALNLQLRAILERVDEPFIATAFYLTVDTATKETQFANAGHPSPMRVRRNERTVERIISEDGKPGPGLGLFDDLNYSTSRSTFEQNDCILLFTDGLFEVESPEGEQFGLEAVISSLQAHANLPAEKLFNALLADACDFSKKQDFDDDVCIVAVEQS
ncbi:MAG: phosphoserine phosphatase RsbU/P [Verrucomicrobiota bacterium]|nr:phosphoserine phosphatase RsbU/P [Verrucomicrobiota bacterium]